MKLDDFLKPRQVRFIANDKHRWELTNGKVYDVIGATYGRLKIHNDNGGNSWYDMTCFELVIESAENPLQNIELTPEFEALDKPQPDWSTAPDGFDWWAKDKDGTAYWFDDLPRKQGDCWGGPCNFEETTIYLNDKPWHESLERRPKVDAITATNDLDSRPMSTRTVSEPKFKVGDKVYIPGDPRVLPILFKNGEWFGVSYKEVNPKYILHATPENYEMLCKLYPHIEFEQPTTQADIDNAAVDKLAQAMKDKLAEKREQGYHGWETCKHGDLVQLLINHVDKGDPIDVANFCAFLFARGGQLTQGGT